MSHVLHTFENDTLKITVEELGGFEFISTVWLKDQDHEVDRRVREFETYGGAVGDAFDTLVDFADLYSRPLTQRPKR